MKMPPPSPLTLFLSFLLLLPLPTTTSTTNNHRHLRRLLHHSFFPSSPSPSPSLHPLPNLPLSTTTTTTPINPFFPSYTTPPPPPPPPPPPSTTALPTFPANISSLALPSSPHSHSHSHKLLPLLLLLSLLTLSLFTTLLFLLLRRRRHLHHHNKPPPPSPPPPPPPPEVYLKLCGSGSPDLNPLPPLPKQRTPTSELNIQPQHLKPHQEDVFYSPTYSSSPSKDSDDISVEIQELLAEAAASSAPTPETRVGPPKLVSVSGPVGLRRSGEMKNGKTKLKGLHWDKVRASSDRVMAWDQLHPSSFQLNEEMTETLFKANSGKDGGRRSMMPLLNEETRVLDPNKSQNVAILLKALNVTEEEVCEALLEGNTDTLGTELLESLLKMAPTKEEEMKLKEYNDESPLKLGPAEKFLKAVLNVPFAFKRVDALLYIATFDSEVEYIRKSFETLEAACQELRNSRIFLKLVEAVLMTGNRMNVGTNRCDAHAFKLDTLLKLADIKGTDGKTTLLHFVVQEIIKSEGSHLSHTNDYPTTQTRPYQTATHDDIESKKRGLEVISGLGGELTNVKKAASMDSHALSTDISKLVQGIAKVEEVLQLNEETGRIENNQRFSESMRGFLTKAEQDIVRIQSHENSAFLRVKELTEYFHGDLGKEEAHPLRIFMVVRDFLGVLDHVCREVGKINDRTVIGATRSLPVSVNTCPPFPAFSGTHPIDNSPHDGNILLT